MNIAERITIGYMNEELKQLFLSQNVEDMELGFIIARKLDINPSFLFEQQPDTLYVRMLFPHRIRLLQKYVRGPGSTLAEWKSEEESNNIII